MIHVPLDLITWNFLIIWCSLKPLYHGVGKQVTKVTFGRKFCYLCSFPHTDLISIEIPLIVLKIQNKVNLKGNWSHIASWNSIVQFRNCYLFCSKENVLVHARNKHIFLLFSLSLSLWYIVYPEGETSVISYFENKCKGTFFEPKQVDVGRKLKKLFIEVRWFIVKSFWMKVVVLGWQSSLDMRSRTYVPNFHWGSLNVTFLKTKQGNLTG